MTIIYDPIIFVKLVQKILVGNYESIMGICEKILLICRICKCCSCCELNINFHNIYPPCTNMKAPNGRLSDNGSAQARRHGGRSGAVTPKSFCAATDLFCGHRFVVLKKFV